METENIVHGMVPLKPLPSGTAGQLIFRTLLRNRHLPDAVINVEKNYSVSYEEILKNSVQLALSLQKCNYGTHSVMAIFSENSHWCYYPLLAGLYLGIAIAPLNHAYIKDELRHALRLSQPSIVFSSLKNVPKVLELKSDLPNIEKVIVLDSNEQIDGVQSLQDLIEESSEDNFDITKFQPAEFNRDEQTAFIMCSSGTTGLPKGVMLTHKNLLATLATLNDQRLAYSGAKRSTTICVIPIVHVVGLELVLCQLTTGCRLILMEKYNSEVYLKAIQDYKIEWLFVVPTTVVYLAKSPRIDKYDLSCLKLILSTTASLPQKIEQLVLQRLNHLKGIAQLYGLTELTCPVLVPPLEEFRSGSTGKVVPFMSAKVIDISTGKALGPNKTGELCFKGDVVMKGYIGNEEATKHVIDENGWLHTGDVGYYDDDGFFYIIDRIKELIKFKGFQVPPTELESYLLQRSDIDDAGVIGIPDEFAGELPTAFVVKRDGAEVTEQEIIDFIAEKVSDPKHLRGGVYFIDELPRNPSGKLLRRELRQLAAAILRSKTN